MAGAIRASRRSRATQVLLAPAGFALAVIGQGFVAGRDFVLDGLLLFALGLLLVWRSIPAAPSAEAAPTSAPAGKRGSRQPLAFGVLALAATGASLLLFGDGTLPNIAWLLLLAGVAFALAGFWRYDGPRPSLTFRRPDQHSLVLLALVFVGLVFRLYRLDSLPEGLWWDEAFSGIHVQQILDDPSYRPVFVGGRGQGAAALWYTMAPFVLLLGPTSLALRATAVLAGTLGILATYLLGRELFGRRVGLVAAALIAVLTWHVNFSRIAFNAVWSVTLDAFAAYFLIRALRTHRLFDFALGGLFLGLAGHMYYTSRLLPVILAVYLAHRLVIERGHLLRRALPGLATYAFLTLLVVSPLVQFGLANPEEFASRIAEASVVNEAPTGGALSSIVENLREHVLMFNYAGDDNGRHNLPGAPMLDQVVGAAFVLGLALALRGIRRPELSLLLAWVAVMLTGGVFSLSFEAPQALRAIEETSAIALLAALPIVGLWGRIESLSIGRATFSIPVLGRATAAAMATAGILLVVGGLNYQRYFVEQANDFAVWAAFSTAETAIARQINALPEGSVVYFDEQYLGHPTIAYLTRGSTEPRRFRPSTSLPLADDSPAAVFLDPETPSDKIHRIYPEARIEAYGPPFEGPPILVTALVSADDVSAPRGLAATFHSGGSFDSPPTRTELLSSFDLGMPNRTAQQYPLAVDVQGTLLVTEYGVYTFSVEATEGSVLSIDESPLLEVGGQGQSVARQVTTLARGIHTIRLRSVLKAAAPVRVRWQRPSDSALAPISSELFLPSVPSNGLLGAYYPNASWSGAPSLEEIGSELAIRFHILALPRPYSVEWRGKLVAPRGGQYRFAVESGGTAWIYVGGSLVATDEGARREIGEGQPIALDAGLHDIRVRFLDTVGHSFIRVYWSPPGEASQLLPGARLLPPRGAYPNLAALLAEPVEARPVGERAGWVETSQLQKTGYRLSQTLGIEAGLKDPRGVAVDLSGNVYVADTGNRRVVKLNREGALTASWGSRGRGEGEFEEPVAVVIEPTGGILVLDAAEGYIQRFTPDGEFLARFGGPAISPYHPRGLAVDETGEIDVADTGASRIDRLGSDGVPLGRYGTRGSGPGQLLEPTDVVRLSDGGLVVVDSAHDRGMRFDPDFRLVAEWKLPPGESMYGPHLAADDLGGVFVSDPEGKRIVRFDSAGKALEQIGGSGELGRPVGLAVDSEGRLFVADSSRGVVQVYERGE